MTVFITQGHYTRDAIQGMIAKPEDRAEAVAALVKAVGGKLLNHYITFGEYDFLVIIQGGKGKSETDTMAALFAAAKPQDDRCRHLEGGDEGHARGDEGHARGEKGAEELQARRSIGLG